MDTNHDNLPPVIAIQLQLFLRAGLSFSTTLPFTNIQSLWKLTYLSKNKYTFITPSLKTDNILYSNSTFTKPFS